MRSLWRRRLGPERALGEVEDAVDVYMQQRRKALDAIARDPQLAALLADERELPPKQPDEAQTDPVAFAALAAHLDERICVPRDVGAPAAAAIRRVAAEVGDGGRAAGDDAAGAGRAEGASRKVNNF